MRTCLIAFFLFTVSNAYFEQRLSRRAIEYHPSKDRVDLKHLTPDLCEPSLQNLTHNATFVTQMCFTKDLFLNMELMIGASKDVFEMAIDLTSPWTWAKSSSCKNCPKFDPSLFPENLQCGNSKKSCTVDEFTKTFDSTHFQDTKKTASIYSDQFMVTGSFLSDQIKFMAYNSSNNGKLTEYIRAKLDMNETLNEIVVNGMKFLGVKRFYGHEDILADGVIGLGFGYTETDEEEAQPDTDFVEFLMKEQTQLQLDRQLFAVYILETGPYFPHFVIQFGGYDVKYAHQHSDAVVWLDRVENSGYYWMVELESMYLNYYQKFDDSHLIMVSKKRAIFSLSTQFIELPKEELTLFLEKMNGIHNETDCHVIDDEVDKRLTILFYKLLLVYCTNLLFPKHFIEMKLHFRFATAQGVKEITLSSFLIFKNCSQHEEDANYFDCLLNIRYSKSQYFILGEPFMKWHYVIFLNQPDSNQQIGILPAATNMYYKDHPKSIFQSQGWSYAKIALYMLLCLILMVFCVANFKRLAKDLFRVIRYSRQRASPSEEGSLRVRNYEEGQSELQDEFNMRKQQADRKDEERREKAWSELNKQFDFQHQSTLEDHSL